MSCTACSSRRADASAQSAAAAFNPAHRLMDQVVEAALLHGTGSRTEAEKRAVALFKKLSLPDPENIGRRFPHQVSGGQLQRVMTAMALCPEPDDRFDSVHDFLHALGGAPDAAPEPRTRVTLDEGAALAPPPRATDEPSRIGTIAAVAFALLVVTNIGWFFYHSATSDEPASAVVPVNERSVLPVGVQLRTVPPTAKVFRQTPAGEVEFGDTPMVLDPKASGTDELHLTVRHRGHEDVSFEVQATPEGHDLILPLPEKDPGPPPADAETPE